MINEILTALGIVSLPTGAGIKGYLDLRDRVQKLESRNESSQTIADGQDAINAGLHEIVTVKLDAISEKIDLRCDTLEKRIDRIERRVLNGEYKADHR